MSNARTPDENPRPASSQPGRLLRRWKFVPHSRKRTRRWDELTLSERAVLERLCELYEVGPGKPLGWTALFSAADLEQAIQEAEHSNRCTSPTEIKDIIRSLGASGFLLEGELWETASNAERARVFVDVKRVWGRGPERN